ncbi:CocE/NonD family hydrolase [Aquimarina litoralis]|uniref:CocE/NonD family hydrolase n=1 Tax=Aquimarina litoralis TaxID=584605 RepID=UPI001C5809AE|nr:CocE/NonD family hydrolase [Aquimarina litoralis]MBW1295197.1 alpha/beta hydrolase [Aquimarina litoralis]
MRILTLLIVTSLQIQFVFCQTSLKEINLPYGAHKVGFKHYTLIDSTRTYRIKNEFNNQLTYRPIPVSVWYPAHTNIKNSQQLNVLDYLQILKEEEEWKNLPDEYLLDWFHYLWNTPQNKAHLPEQAHSFANAPMLKEKFPVIVYASSYEATSIENFAMFEYLASYGYVIISSPSRGTSIKELEGATPRAAETQSRDTEFILKEIHNYSNITMDKIALMGYSFGGLSNIITAMKNPNIKALISLDGSERYNYKVLNKSPYFNIQRFDIPYIHFAQKDIPEAVLISDKIPAELNYQFKLYDSLKYNEAYSFKFHDLTHSYFSSFGVLFANRDKRQDKSDDEIMRSYRLLSQYTLQFLNFYLKENGNKNRSIASLEINDKLVSLKTKKGSKKAFNYRDFNDLALYQNYQDLIKLYQREKEKHPTLMLEEGMLNTLGLRLSFDPNKIEQGIQVFLLALHIYPDSSNLYDSLAEAYLLNKDVKNAIINFKKSLALNPQNQNAVNKLKLLKQ